MQYNIQYTYFTEPRYCQYNIQVLELMFLICILKHLNHGVCNKGNTTQSDS